MTWILEANISEYHDARIAISTGEVRSLVGVSGVTEVLKEKKLEIQGLLRVKQSE